VLWYRITLAHVVLHRLPDNANASGAGTTGGPGAARTSRTTRGARTARRHRSTRTAGRHRPDWRPRSQRRHRTTGRQGLYRRSGTKGRHRRSRQARPMPRRRASQHRSLHRKSKLRAELSPKTAVCPTFADSRTSRIGEGGTAQTSTHRLQPGTNLRAPSFSSAAAGKGWESKNAGFTYSGIGLPSAKNPPDVTDAVQHAHNSDCSILDPVENYVVSR